MALTNVAAAAHTQLVIRSGRARVAQLQRCASVTRKFRREAWIGHPTSLLTGGTGGLGLLVSALLVSHGDRQLVLVSRSGSVAVASEKTSQALSGCTSTVRVEMCNVSDSSGASRAAKFN